MMQHFTPDRHVVQQLIRYLILITHNHPIGRLEMTQAQSDITSPYHLNIFVPYFQPFIHGLSGDYLVMS